MSTDCPDCAQCDCTDIVVSAEGSLYLFTPHTGTGSEWLNDHLPEDAPMFGPAFVVESRYALEIAQGALDDGLAVA